MDGHGNWIIHRSLYETVQVSGEMERDGYKCCIRCGPDEERILDVVPREDGARDSG